MDGNSKVHAAVIRSVHTDDPSGLYCTISLNGAERQTSIERLRVCGSAADDWLEELADKEEVLLQGIVAELERQGKCVQFASAGGRDHIGPYCAPRRLSWPWPLLSVSFTTLTSARRYPSHP